jgi:hypothetical protein
MCTIANLNDTATGRSPLMQQIAPSQLPVDEAGTSLLASSGIKPLV